MKTSFSPFCVCVLLSLGGSALITSNASASELGIWGQRNVNSPYYKNNNPATGYYAGYSPGMVSNNRNAYPPNNQIANNNSVSGLSPVSPQPPPNSNSRQRPKRGPISYNPYDFPPFNNINGSQNYLDWYNSPGSPPPGYPSFHSGLPR